MRTLTVFFFAALLLASSLSPATAQRAERTVSDTVPLSETGTVSIDNHDGAITITPWDRAEVSFEARVTHSEQQGVDNTQIRVDRSSNRVSIVTDFEDVESSSRFFGMVQNREAPDVDYTIRIPTGASLEIDDHESEISVDGLAGDVAIDTHDGRIDVRNHGGDLVIDSRDGDILLESIAGSVEIDTHDSPISARGLRGGVTIDAHDGDIDLEFAAVTGEIRIDSHDAEARLTLPADAGFDIATNMGDDADLDIEPSMSDVSIDDNRIRGSVNGGGPRIRVSSHDGRLSIRTQ